MITKRNYKRMWYIIVTILAVWVILTLWAEAKGRAALVTVGNNAGTRHVLIVYDPDPFYNFDEQICTAFANGLLNENTRVSIATVAAAEKLNGADFLLYVFCANTYNWQPDWAISGFIKKHPHLKNKPAVAIILGAGSTAASKKTLENIIRKKEALLVDSRSFWLIRPNDESGMKEKNTTVALSKVRLWAAEIAQRTAQW